FRRKLVYLGHEIDKNDIRPNPGKVEAVLKIPPPKNVSDLRRFLGMPSYYRRFIKDYAKIATPLNAMIAKDSLYKWTDACDVAFNTLKEKLTTAPILAYPDFNRPFRLYTDVSDFALGAVLAQIDSEKREQVIAYAS